MSFIRQTNGGESNRGNKPSGKNLSIFRRDSDLPFDFTRKLSLNQLDEADTTNMAASDGIFLGNNGLQNDFQNVSALWEPPKSCQRRIINPSIKSVPSTIGFSVGSSKSSMNDELVAFFPIELTDGDYSLRVLKVLANLVSTLAQSAVTSTDFIKLVASSLSQTTEISNISKFLNLLMCFRPQIAASLHILNQHLSNGETVDCSSIDSEHLQVHSFMLLCKWVKIESVRVDISSGASSSTSELLSNSIAAVFAAYNNCSTACLEQDSKAGRLVSAPVNELFAAARGFVSLLATTATAAVSAAESEQLSVSHVLHSAEKELFELQEQKKLHQIFKEQRMAALGWQWPSVLSSENNGSAIETSVQKLRGQAADLRQQLLELIEPLAFARLQLIHRLLGIAQDVDLLMVACSEDADYQEARRLRELKAAVDSTVPAADRQLLDHAQLNYRQALQIADELKAAAATVGSTGNYEISYLMAEDADELLALSRLMADGGLHGVGSSSSSVAGAASGSGAVAGMQVDSDFSLIGSSTEISDQLARVGTALITSDFLFTAEHGTDGQTLKGLILRAQAGGVLSHIQNHWPHFSVMRSAASRTPLHTSQSCTATSPASGRNGTLAAFSQSQINLNAPRDNNASEASAAVAATEMIKHMQQSYRSALHNEQQAADMRSGTSPPPHPTAPASSRQRDIGSRLLSSRAASTSANASAIFAAAPRSSTGGVSGASSTAGIAAYNEVGFAPSILNILLSFDELQQQLQDLMKPASVALTQLLLRLMGTADDLLRLSEFNKQAGAYDESQRLLLLRGALESTVDADAGDEHDALVCGRSRRRFDAVKVLLQLGAQGGKELQRLAAAARTESDFTGAQALSDAAAGLVGAMRQVQQVLLAPFSFLDSEGSCCTDKPFPGSTAGGSFEIDERIARDGTAFLTADFIFNYCSGAEGHSIGSLAIVAGAGAVLRHIRAAWPGITALAPPQLNLTATGGATALKFLHDGENRVDFRDCSALRLMGFDAYTLRRQGFDDIEVLTAGFTAAQLRDAGFDTRALRSAGLTDSALRVVGYKNEQQFDVLLELFNATGGSVSKQLRQSSDSRGWLQSDGWTQLAVAASAHESSAQQIDVVAAAVAAGVNLAGSPTVLSSPKPFSSAAAATSSSWRSPQRTNRGSSSGGGSTGKWPTSLQLQSLHGLKFDPQTNDVTRLSLNKNGLSGVLPDSIGSLTSLTHLSLGENSLTGAIPAALGLLVNLESLCLHCNSFTGAIPKSLKHLQLLAVLRLENNRLEGPIPGALGALTALKRLDLSGNQLSGPIPARLSNLLLLEELILHSNALCSGVPETLLSQLSQLTGLQLHNNRLEGEFPVHAAVKLRRLTGLTLHGNTAIKVDRLKLQRALPKCRIKL